MTELTGPIERFRRDGDIYSYTTEKHETIYKGALVGLTVKIRIDQAVC